jgi:hypothetical protein
VGPHFERFAEDLAEPKMLEKKQKTGRGSKVRPEKTEKEGVKEKVVRQAHHREPVQQSIRMRSGKIL